MAGWDYQGYGETGGPVTDPNRFLGGYNPKDFEWGGDAYGAEADFRRNFNESAPQLDTTQADQARGFQTRAADMTLSRAMGRNLVSHQIAQQQQQQANARIASQSASARGGAGLALANQTQQQNQTASGAQIAGQAAIAGAQEQTAAENALAQQGGAMRQQDETRAGTNAALTMQQRALRNQYELGGRQAQMMGRISRQDALREAALQKERLISGEAEAARARKASFLEKAFGAMTMGMSGVAGVSDMRAKEPVNLASRMYSDAKAKDALQIGYAAGQADARRIPAFEPRQAAGGSFPRAGANPDDVADAEGRGERVVFLQPSETVPREPVPEPSALEKGKVSLQHLHYQAPQPLVMPHGAFAVAESARDAGTAAGRAVRPYVGPAKQAIQATPVMMPGLPMTLQGQQSGMQIAADYGTHVGQMYAPKHTAGHMYSPGAMKNPVGLSSMMGPRPQTYGSMWHDITGNQDQTNASRVYDMEQLAHIREKAAEESKEDDIPKLASSRPLGQREEARSMHESPHPKQETQQEKPKEEPKLAPKKMKSLEEQAAELKGQVAVWGGNLQSQPLAIQPQEDTHQYALADHMYSPGEMKTPMGYDYAQGGWFPQGGAVPPGEGPDPWAQRGMNPPDPRAGHATYSPEFGWQQAQARDNRTLAAVRQSFQDHERARQDKLTMYKKQQRADELDDIRLKNSALESKLQAQRGGGGGGGMSQAQLGSLVGTGSKIGEMLAQPSGGGTAAYDRMLAIGNMKSDERAKTTMGLRDFMSPPDRVMKDANRSLEGKMYAYKPGMAPPEQATGEPNVGPMADTMERNPVSGTAIKRDEQGMRYIDRDKALKLTMSGIASLQEQIDQLKKKKGRAA